MKIPALSMASPLAGRLLREGATLINDVECEAVVHVDQAYLGHHGPEQNYRPYLRLAGEMRSLVPAERLPGDVHELAARPTLGPTFDVFYEFTDDQLGEMVKKGYFSRDFNVPPMVSNTTYELPVTASVLVLEPYDREAGDVPLVFVDVHNKNSLVLDLESSGYDLQEYFESVRRPERDLTAQEEFEASRQQMYGVDDPRLVDDIFSDPRFDGLRAAEAARLAEMDAEQARLDAQRAEVIAARERAAAGIVDEPEANDAGDEAVMADEQHEDDLALDQLYEQIVRPYVEDRVAPVADEPVVAPKQSVEATEKVEPVPVPALEADDSGELSFDDFEDDEDLGPEPISTGDAPDVRAAAQRAVRQAREGDGEQAVVETAENREIGG